MGRTSAASPSASPTPGRDCRQRERGERAERRQRPDVVMTVEQATEGKAGKREHEPDREQRRLGTAERQPESREREHHQHPHDRPRRAQRIGEERELLGHRARRHALDREAVVGDREPPVVEPGQRPVQRRRSHDQRDAESECPERAERFAGRAPAAPGGQQEPDAGREAAVVAGLLDEHAGTREETGGDHQPEAPAHLPARGERQRDQGRERGHQLAVGREALDHGRAREQPAEQRGCRSGTAAGQVRDEQPQHDGDCAGPQRRHQADVEPVRARQRLGPAVEQQQPLRPVDPDVAVQVCPGRPPARDVAITALVDRQRGRQKRQMQDE